MNKDFVSADMEDGTRLRVERNTPIGRIIRSKTSLGGLPYLGALVNNEVLGLNALIESSAHIRMLDMKDPLGWLIYRSTVTFILNMAVNQLYSGHHFTVEHSLGSGFFCRFYRELESFGSGDIRAIEERMRTICKAAHPIERIKVPFELAMKEFESEGHVDKYKLLRFRNPPYIEMHRCDGFFDLAHSVLAESTGDVSNFKCIPHEDGLIVQLASIEDAPHLTKFEYQPNLFSIFQEHKQWGRILGVRTAGDLNEVIADGDISEFIRTAEALHEKKIACLADQISNNDSDVKWIFMAGPSSSGKTTFAKRLSVQLKLNGLKPYLISIDDFFVDRDVTPLDEHGKLDFENIESVDLELLHSHLAKLDRGEAVNMPRFDFTVGKRRFSEEPFRIGDGRIMIVEGIHGLNPKIWNQLPSERVFKIYVSALTQLNLDFHNRLSTTDNRLMRRLVRDHKFRNHNALATLGMWPSVRRGENRWIFPFQEEADAAFNSALDYEIPVLKPFVEPLLLEVKPYHEVYPAARRVMEFLDNFLNIYADHVPPTSILREFIGESSFRY